MASEQNPPYFPGTLLNVGYKYLLRHPIQTGLMIIGIMLGVAVFIAIDLANASASRAFDLSVDSITGRTTHQIVAGPGGVDEDLYPEIVNAQYVDAVAPVITDYVNSPEIDGGRPLQLLGIDPFAEPPFRNYLGEDNVGLPIEQLTAFLTDPGAVLISTDIAADNNLEIGDTITLEISGREYAATIAGLLQPSDSLSARTLNGVILADIATAQEITNTFGTIERVDLIIPEEQRADVVPEIEAALPESVRLSPAEARTGSVEEMTAAFRVNLLALSLLALVVGMFLIYNTMTFSVVQRRRLFGTLRSIGVTRREIFLMVVGEALLVGVVGSLLGIALGILLGQGAVRLVTQTINDLFFVVTVRGVQIPPRTLLVGSLLGILATMASAAIPAIEAALVPPRAALTRSTLESRAGAAVKWTFAGGVLLNAAGLGLLLIPSRSLPLSFAATFMVIIGFALLTPIVLVGLMRAFKPLTTALLGILGRMAPREIEGSLSRTSVAVAALMVAVSVTIGISLMVGSFRRTVIVWLEQTLEGDVYMSVAGGTATRPSTAVDPEVIDTVTAWPGVDVVTASRSVTVDSEVGPINLVAVSNQSYEEGRIYYSTTVPESQVFEATRDGAVAVSEPFARRFDKWDGDTITLETDNAGSQTFEIVAVYYDYGQSAGTVGMALEEYQRLWDDDRLTALALFLETGVSPDDVAQGLQEELAGVQDLLIRPNLALRQEVLVVFDRTFAITGALNILATIVAFIGVLSSLLSLQLEKRQQLGILRSIGLTVRQLWGLVLLETGLMGLVAGIMALPTGFVLSLILIYIINRRSFGWTLQLNFLPEPFIQALLVAIIAALLAGIYPAWRVSKMVTANAIRFE